MKTVVDKPLDDIIKSSKKKEKNNVAKKGTVRGPARKGRARERGRRIQKGPRGHIRPSKYRNQNYDRDYWQRPSRRSPPRRRRPEDLRQRMESRRGRLPEVRRQDPRNKLFVDNLPMKFSSEELNELFAEVGYLTKCKLVLDDFGKSKGRAVVVYENFRDAERAIDKFHENKLDGKIISVEFAPERPRESGNRNPYNGHDSRLERMPPRGERGPWRSSRRDNRRY